MSPDSTSAADAPRVVVPDALPVLPLRDAVVFPLAIAPLVVGQERSIKLIDEAMRSTRTLVLVAQRSSEGVATGPQDLYDFGTVSAIHQMMRAPDGTLRLVLQGQARVRLLEFIRTDPYFVARIAAAPELETPDLETEALARTAREVFKRLVHLSPGIPDELADAVDQLREPREVAYQIASSAPFSTADRQALLEIDAVQSKLRRLVELLQHEIAVRELEQRIAAETHEEMTKAQRDYFLREQLRAIQKELGEIGREEAEVNDLRDRIAKASLPEEARKEAERELNRLARIPDASPENGIVRTYLDWMASLPWNTTTGKPIDVPIARAVLDEDHYDLERIKDRILEYLAVKKMRDERHGTGAAAAPSTPATATTASGDGRETPRPLASAGYDESRHEPILCFVGPPGVGKTSLGQSIARAMGRRFVRMSLGGIHDESEIRGHRRTYIGAMPGRIIQALRRAEACDPVFMLDEVDKLGVGFHGDPASALLEVLDPAQNHAFTDTYLGVPFDLSRALFICTANTLEAIPAPLLDRTEVITLAGYTEMEKLHIARRYLLPRALKANGLADGEMVLDDEAIAAIIRDYTREAGVRNLERTISAVIRKVARRISEGAKPPIRVVAADLPGYLGAPRFYDEVAERIDRPGVATGLAWTPTGGHILFIEATMMRAGEERLILTGMLGDVMRESAQAALSYLRANAAELGFEPYVFDGKTVHIHVPAGAIPKDGPSAGVAIIAALASIASGRPVRNDVAMTGEISLRGKVLPVGGIKEKVLAAHRAGLSQIVLPKRNQPDLDELPAEVRQQLQFTPVDSVEEALATVLAPKAEKRPPPPTPPPPPQVGPMH